METGIRNPETGNRNPQIKENKFFKYSKIVLLRFLPIKNKRPSKNDLKLNLFWNKNSPSVELRATVISSEGYYNYENLSKVHRNFVPSNLRASKISLLVINRAAMGRARFMFYPWFTELFFCKKIPLSRRFGYVMNRSMDEWVRDVCMSHQSDWIYYKQPIKFLVVKVNSIWGD